MANCRKLPPPGGGRAGEGGRTVEGEGVGGAGVKGAETAGTGVLILAAGRTSIASSTGTSASGGANRSARGPSPTFGFAGGANVSDGFAGSSAPSSDDTDSDD